MENSLNKAELCKKFNLTNNTISISSTNNIPIRTIYQYNNTSFENFGQFKTEL